MPSFFDTDNNNVLNNESENESEYENENENGDSLIPGLINELVSLMSCEQLDLKNNINTVFNQEHEKKITPLLVNPSIYSKLIEVPSFDSGKNYSKICKNLKDGMSDMIDKLKTESLKISWLQEEITYQAPDSVKDETTDIKNNEKKKLRQRRTPKQLNGVKTNNCPFSDCNKTYTAKTSLRLHIRQNHKKGDPVKPNFEEPNMSNNLSKKFVDIYKVFKVDHAKKIERRGEDSTRGSFETSNMNDYETIRPKLYSMFSEFDGSKDYQMPTEKNGDFVSEFLNDIKDPDCYENNMISDEFINFSDCGYNQDQTYDVFPSISTFDHAFLPEGIEFGYTEDCILFNKRTRDQANHIFAAETGELMTKRNYSEVDFDDQFVGLGR